MENQEETRKFNKFFRNLSSFVRKFIFKILSVGPIPNHIAFILDGNRRYARKHDLKLEDAGHRAGFLALMSILKYCRELGIKYITVYAFSIDNFRRRPEEIQYLMDLMLEKIEIVLKEVRTENQYGVRIVFVGDMNLLSEPLRDAAEKAMEATAKNTRMVILVCVAYSTRQEIVHAVKESCERKLSGESYDSGEDRGKAIEVGDVEECLYMAIAPEPEILIRTSGENRLSNFLIWQTRSCLLYSPAVLWPEIGLRHLVWALLKFQKMKPYLEKKKKLV